MSFFVTPWPAYLIGISCIGRGCFALLGPRSEYRRVGLALEGAPPDQPTHPAGLVSPLMLFKGIREVSYGVTIVLLQRRGLDEALTTFAAVLAGVRIADALVVWWNAGKGLRYRTVGHVLAAAMMGFWVWKRRAWKEMLPLMHDLRAAGFNPPFKY